MDSLMLLGLPGRQLYCLMPTDQYYVFQHYFIRRRSTRSPRDIRHAEISRYTPEASGGRKHAQVQDLRIPRRAVTGATLKMHRTPFLGLDNCARLTLKLSDGATHRFAVLGSHTQAELREIFGVGGPQSAEPRVCDARSGFTPPAANLPSFVPPTPAPVKQAPLRNRQGRRERIRAHLEDMAGRRNEKLRPLVRAVMVLPIWALFFSFADSQSLFGRGAPVWLAPAICFALILVMLSLPALVPQWYSLFLSGWGRADVIPVGLFIIPPALGLLFRCFWGVTYVSLPRFFLIAAIPGAVIAVLVWVFARERKIVPGTLTVYCCVLLVLLVGIGGRINMMDAYNPPDRTERAKVVERQINSFGNLDEVTVRTSRGEMTFRVPDSLYNSVTSDDRVTVDFHNGVLGIPYATEIHDPH